MRTWKIENEVETSQDAEIFEAIFKTEQGWRSENYAQGEEIVTELWSLRLWWRKWLNSYPDLTQ